jgi:hypothetical protein
MKTKLAPNQDEASSRHSVLDGLAGAEHLLVIAFTGKMKVDGESIAPFSTPEVVLSKQQQPCNLP